MQEQFTENANSAYYKGFLEDLGTFGASNTAAWLNVRKRLFERTLYVASPALLTHSHQLTHNITQPRRRGCSHDTDCHAGFP